MIETIIKRILVQEKDVIKLNSTVSTINNTVKCKPPSSS